MSRTAVSRIVISVALLASTAHADPTSGVDTALFRPSYDSNGIFAVEGARLLPVHDLSFKFMAGYGTAPLNVSVPGIGGGLGDTAKDHILKYLGTLDMTFGMTLLSHVAIGFDVAAYRTATASGYGVRGMYGSGGVLKTKSTGLIALRPLSNIDQSANPNDPTAYVGDGLAGPLDARVGLKIGLYSNPHIAFTAIGSVGVPFGDEQMLVGDRNLVFEPKLAFEFRPTPYRQTRIVANAAMRLRQRAVLEGYDTADPAATQADAKAFLDVGSEAVAGLGAAVEVVPRFILAAEAQVFAPLPRSFDYGSCYRYNGATCASMGSADYWPGAKKGDFTTLATAGMMLRISGDVTADLMAGTSQGGARSEDLRVTAGIVWAPQPDSVAVLGRNDKDRDGVPDSVDMCPDDPEDKDGVQDDDGCPDPDNDGDGIPDSVDQCPNEAEDKDGFQDEDGCPERDNDNDGIPDTGDRCPNEAEDKDGFEDDDGCPDRDNDGDGYPDDVDKCPNDPETVNAFEDDDGCPDTRTSGVEERPDRIEVKGQGIAFDRTNRLTAGSKAVLGQVASIVKSHKLTIRIEVSVPLGTKSTNGNVIAFQKRRDKQVAQRRAQEIVDYLVTQGVPLARLQAVGIGSSRPVRADNPSDATNERIEIVKVQ